MFKFIAHLWSAALDLTSEQRRSSVRIAAWVGFVIVAMTLLAAGGTAGRVVPADHPIWEAVLQTRLALVRLVLAVPLMVIGAISAVAIFQVLENSALGARITDINDPAAQAEEWAAALRNRGTILAALFLACILGLLFGVLR